MTLPNIPLIRPRSGGECDSSTTLASLAGRPEVSPELLAQSRSRLQSLSAILMVLGVAVLAVLIPAGIMPWDESHVQLGLVGITALEV